MKKKLILLAAAGMLIFNSCSSDVEPVNYSGEFKTKSTSDSRVQLLDGILVFDSEQSLKEVVDGFNRLSTKEKRNYFIDLYSSGFDPLHLNYLEDTDIALMERFAERKALRIEGIKKRSPHYMSDDLYEFGDDLITDDAFASFLNDKREIIVADKMYKYTYQGILTSSAKEKANLQFIADSEGYDFTVPITVPDPGTDPVSPGVDIIVLPPQQNILPCGGGAGAPYLGFQNLPAVIPDCPPMSLPAPDFGDFKIAQQIDFMDTLEPCDAMTGFLDNLWGLLGTRRVCHDYFDGKRRTKTLYYKENYLVYRSIGIKVKHQKFKDILFGVGWWYASDTDEVAVSVSQATFKYEMAVNFPHGYKPKHVFIDNYMLNEDGQVIDNLNNYNGGPGPFPSLPFNVDVTVSEFLDGVFTPDQVRDLFYQGTWQLAKNTLKSLTNRDDVKQVAHIVYTPSAVYVNYVDLETRKLNDQEIIKVLDYNWAFQIKFNVYFDGNGNYSTNLHNFLSDPLGFISPGNLYDYTDVKMDFVGASRHGDVWKGSRIVYSD